MTSHAHHAPPPIITHHSFSSLLFFRNHHTITSTMRIPRAPSFGGCILACSQDTNLPLPPPSPPHPKHRPTPSNHLQPSRFLPPQTDSYPGTKRTFLCRLLTVSSLRLNLRHPCALPRFRIIRRSGRSV